MCVCVCVCVCVNKVIGCCSDNQHNCLAIDFAAFSQIFSFAISSLPDNIL